ncbi:MAG: hypothetical protein Q9226_003868 [Calogaya cf. arnoldii]
MNIVFNDDIDSEDWLYEIVFCPGYVYFGRHRNQHATFCSLPTKSNVARPSLLCLSKRIKEKYQTRMWSENTWVLHGSPTPPVNFYSSVPYLDRISYKARQHIQKMHLKFGHLADKAYEVANWEGGFIYSYEPHEPEWQDGWKYVKNLPFLPQLMLDFTECRRKGERGGLYVALRLGSWQGKIVPKVEILGPEEHLHELEEIIHKSLPLGRA